MYDQNYTTIVKFLESIGIRIVERDLAEDTFLPGLMLGPDCIYIDHKKLKYPGDILHEAGHIAVTSPSERKLIGTQEMPQEWPTQGDEIVAILWSFAALNHLQLKPDFVFHENGYKGNSKWFIDNFTSGNFMGLPLLEWYKMTNKTEFPKMRHWIRPD